MTDRLDDLRRFYSILDGLAVRLGGRRLLGDCDGRGDWPARGVYFFYEAGEFRTDSGHDPRVVRVGTHALKTGSRSTLWKRLAQHRGQRDGGGDHRGSIFRLHVGTALTARRPDLRCDTWGRGATASRQVRDGERRLEAAVSSCIRQMPLVWLSVPDEPGPGSARGDVERNAIALLSNAGKPPLDRASLDWLGGRCDRDAVRSSGLWNVNHVADVHDPAFLDRLERLVEAHR